MPLNFMIRGKEIPLGLALITLMLFLIAVVNLFTKPIATVAGGVFSVVLFIVFTVSEKTRAASAAARTWKWISSILSWKAS